MSAMRHAQQTHAASMVPPPSQSQGPGPAAQPAGSTAQQPASDPRYAVLRHRQSIGEEKALARIRLQQDHATADQHHLMAHHK
jgi:hypothetical protein